MTPGKEESGIGDVDFLGHFGETWYHFRQYSHSPPSVVIGLGVGVGQGKS